MEVQQVRSFVEVARQRSFSKAAAKLFRTQPTITVAVQALEREIGTDLFERSSRGVRLTLAGQALLETVGPLLQSWEAAAGKVRESVDGLLRGPVRVGAGEAAVLYLLPGPIRRFLRRNPEVELVVRHQTAKESLSMLREGELDFAVRSLASVPSDMLYHPFLTCDRVLLCPRSHSLNRAKSVTLEALSKFRLVMPWKESITRRLIERAFEDRGLPCNVALEAGGWEIIKRYVGLSLGIAVVPEFCIEPPDRHLTARSVRHLFGQDSYGLVFKKGRSLSAASRILAAEFVPRLNAAD